MTAVVFVLAALGVGGLIQAEIKGYADWLPEKLVRLAVKRLPLGARATREEEWLAELEDMRQIPLSRLIWALRLVIGAGRMSASTIETKEPAVGPVYTGTLQATLPRVTAAMAGVVSDTVSISDSVAVHLSAPAALSGSGSLSLGRAQSEVDGR